MAFTSENLEITLRYTFLGQRCSSVRTYRATGAAFLTASPAGVGEAWWNDVKTAWRGLAASGLGNVFDSVFVREIGGGLSYGEYAIPTAERVGTRASGSLGDSLPSYVAVGCKLTVATGVTRPGQVRFPFLADADTVANDVAAPFLTLCQAVAAKYSSVITLGAPVATGTLTPTVLRYTKTVPPAVDARQDINGYLLNAKVTTQVSRRVGRGT